MTPSRTDKSLSPADSANLAPNEVNQFPLATQQCPNYPRFDASGTIEERILSSRKSQRAPSQFITDVGALIGNPNYHPSPRNCPPLTPDVTSGPLRHAQPLLQRALRYPRRNARRAADENFPTPAHPEPTYDRSKIVQPTVLGSIPSTHDFPTKMPVTKRERNNEPNHCLPDSSPNPVCTPFSRTPREFPALPMPPRAPPRQRTMTSKITNSNKKLVMATSVAAPTSPSAPTGTDSANV